MMPLFILTETSAGYALLKARDKKLLEKSDLSAEVETVEQVCSQLKLKSFQKFDSAATALEEVSALVDGKVTPRLASLLETIKDAKKASLAVADPKLGNAINKLPQLSIKPISDSTTNDLYRSIRDHLPALIPGLLPSDISTMSLGLSHSLSRHKLKFSPDKIDTMVVQAIALLDDLDKELNTYAMRVKEWYGWHFPEMGRIVNDNLAFAKVILKMGMRTNAANSDLAEILPEEIEAAVKAAAEVSMGTEITLEDLENIQALAEQVVNFTEYRLQLSGYLSARMTAIAPNLTILVGDLVGARLIAHAGSLMNLAKSPASTIQILGAEKALFRALKTKHDTPKYGLIYHASLIGQATGKNKGKIARVLAAKAAICLRVDALADWGGDDLVTEEEKAALGVTSRHKIERRLAQLEGKPLRSKESTIAPNGTASQPGKWEVKEARKYNPDADGLTGDEPAAVGSKVPVQFSTAVADAVMADANEIDEKLGAEDGSDVDEEAASAESLKLVPRLSISTTAPAIERSGDESDTITTVSADTPHSPNSPTQQETNWQSSILGNTKDAKKARKKERHERKLALSEERSKKKALKNEKLARRLDRKERRAKKEEQQSRREERDREQFGMLAKQAGLTVTRYKRKLERGEISFGADGTPVAISKKDMKKTKENGGLSGSKAGSKKRKLDGASLEPEKKKKKRSSGTDE